MPASLELKSVIIERMNPQGLPCRGKVQLHVSAERLTNIGYEYSFTEPMQINVAIANAVAMLKDELKALYATDLQYPS